MNIEQRIKRLEEKVSKTKFLKESDESLYQEFRNSFLQLVSKTLDSGDKELSVSDYKKFEVRIKKCVRDGWNRLRVNSENDLN